ncbi:MAG: c-type cytochrome [Gemmatimonadota bacterium]|nr:c-type cytochrome [Gemmatimonadota bacterium]
MPYGSGRLGAALTVAALLAAPVALGGCEWFSTMSDPAAIQPHEREPWAPPERSVPLDGDPAYDLSNVDAVLSNPWPADSASVAVGKEYYDAFCTVCHGETGLGDGPLTDKFPAIPSIIAAADGGQTDAYLYGIITQGRGLMPGYSRIPKPARWHIVNFMRTLPGRIGGEGGAPADTAGGGSP